MLVAHLRGTRQREGNQRGLEVILYISSGLEPTHPLVGNPVQLMRGLHTSSCTKGQCRDRTRPIVVDTSAEILVCK